jgi:hypothetical protein
MYSKDLLMDGMCAWGKDRKEEGLSKWISFRQGSIVLTIGHPLSLTLQSLDPALVNEAKSSLDNISNLAN